MKYLVSLGDLYQSRLQPPILDSVTREVIIVSHRGKKSNRDVCNNTLHQQSEMISLLSGQKFIQIEELQHLLQQPDATVVDTGNKYAPTSIETRFVCLQTDRQTK